MSFHMFILYIYIQLPPIHLHGEVGNNIPLLISSSTQSKTYSTYCGPEQIEGDFFETLPPPPLLLGLLLLLLVTPDHKYSKP